MKRIALLVGLIAGLFFGSLVEAQSPDVYLLEYEGIVNDGMADFVARGIAEADLVNAEAVVLVLDTPGGAVDVTLDIVKTIRSSDVPVIVFVGPAGAQAASAGSVITLAGHGAVMAPETVIGAAAVVDAAGGDIGETMQAKINEDLTATMRGLTERRGEEAMALAEAMILDAEAVSASEALAIGLIDGIEADVDGVLRVMDGETVVVNGDEVVLDLGDAVRTPVETNWLEKLKLAVGDPALISLLISLGTIAIIWEVRAPGGYVAGALGVVALGLAYYGLGQVSANMLGLGLVALAALLFVLETQTPTFGLMSFLGFCGLVGGLWVLFNTGNAPEYVRLSLWTAVAVSIPAALLFGWVAVAFARSWGGKTFTGKKGMLGERGTVRKPLKPFGQQFKGTVLVRGEIWNAVAKEAIAAEMPIKVHAVDGMTLIVAPTEYVHVIENELPF